MLWVKKLAKPFGRAGGYQFNKNQWARFVCSREKVRKIKKSMHTGLHCYRQVEKSQKVWYRAFPNKHSIWIDTAVDTLL